MEGDCVLQFMEFNQHIVYILKLPGGNLTKHFTSLCIKFETSAQLARTPQYLLFTIFLHGINCKLSWGYSLINMVYRWYRKGDHTTFGEKSFWCTTHYFKKDVRVHFYGWGSTASRLQSHYEETVYFLALNPQKFLVLIWSTSERWKAELTLEPLSWFEHATPGLGIQHLNY